MCYAGYGRILYVGGISGLGLMKSEHEILEIDCTKVTVRAVPSGFPADISPFLIGHSVVCLEDRIVICGGGGMCFDFGACMNNGLWTLGDTERFDSWKFIEEGKGADHSPRDLDTPMPDTPDPETFSETPGPAPVSREVKTATITTAVEFESIIEAGEPVVLQGLDLGPCTTNWTPDYLKATVSPGRNVTVLAANSLHTFRPKSPRSQTMPFPDFIDAVFNTPDFRLHLRSISSTNPSPAPASFPQDFPNLSKDFHLPPALLPAKLHQHSTPLRISSTGVNTWLHYDNMASITCHMVGEKLIRLYPPSDVTRLSFPHGSATSSIPDIFLRPSSPAGTSPYTATLAPGDVLFIPPLWLHAVKPLTPSVAVMVFFRNLEGDAYAHGRDVYANRDLAAYEKGRRKVQGIVQDFALLPVELRRFYIGRLVEELREGMEE